MSEARDARVIEESRRQIERLSRLGWYHSIELPGGSVIEGHQTIRQLRTRIRQFPIPEDLTGKRVLDIGAWDGWFSFEMERRGAQVLALDSTRNTRLLEAKKLLGSRIEYHIGDICRVTSKDLGTFDIVLFLGVLYHVKHPLLALENVCGMCREMACIESFVTDPDPSAIPACLASGPTLPAIASGTRPRETILRPRCFASITALRMTTAFRAMPTTI